MALDQRDLPASAGQRQGSGAAGQPGSYHQGAAGLMVFSWALIPGRAPVTAARAVELAAEHLPLAPVTLDLVHEKACRLQAATYFADAGKGGQGGACGRQSGKLGVERGLPHVRIPGRGKAIQKPGIDAGIQLRQGIEYIANQQGQGYPAVRQVEMLPAGGRVTVLGQQLTGPGLQFRPQGQRPLQIGMAQGIFFTADKMQMGIGRGQLLPELPGAEEVKAGTEAGFTNAEVRAGGQFTPAPGQIIVLQEYMTGFRQARLAGEIHIIEVSGKGLSVVRPAQLGERGWGIHGLSGAGSSALL